MKALLRAALAACLMLSPAFADEGESLRREGFDLITPRPIGFKAGSAELLPGSDKDLNLLKDYLVNTAYISSLRIEGHVTSGADESERLALSQQRALAVLKWLAAHGIDCKRLIAVGFGSSKPALTPPDPGNERLVFTTAGLRGKAIGGLPLDGGGAVAASGCE